MTTRHTVAVSCSEGFMDKGFANREAAQRWIDSFNQSRTTNPLLCQGEHKIIEQPASDASPPTA